MAAKKVPTSQILDLKPKGSALIEDAERWCTELRQALEAHPAAIRLDLSGLGPVDVSFLQLLLCLEQSLERQGGQLVFVPLPQEHETKKIARLLGIPLTWREG